MSSGTGALLASCSGTEVAFWAAGADDGPAAVAGAKLTVDDRSSIARER